MAAKLSSYRWMVVSRVVIVALLAPAAALAQCVAAGNAKPAGCPLAAGETPVMCPVNARDFGAKGDSKTDDTAAIQAALQAAAQQGKVCYLPAGRYRLEGSLVIPPSVVLRGSFEGTPHPLYPTGTVLLVCGGKGNPEGTPCITLKFSSVIRNLIIHYPEQQSPPQVVPYPWTIRGDGQLCQVIDIAMTNPYQAMDFGTKNNELHMVRNVFACPLKIGLYIDQCYDVGRIENVHFNPNLWKRLGIVEGSVAPPAGLTESEGDTYQNKILEPYLRENLIGFKIGKTDWEYMTNCFVIMAKYGFLIDDFGHGPGNALVTQSGSDVGPVAVQINKTQEHSGYQFANCQFMATIVIGPENKGPIKISNSGFWPVPDTAEQIVKHGPGSLILSACHFHDWDWIKNGAACIRADGGRMSLTGCEFMQSKPQIRLEKGLTAATLTGCMFRGKKAIIDQSGAEVQMGLNTTE